MDRPQRYLWIALWTLWLGAPADATNGSKPIAIGARAAGRAGVDYAYADDATGPGTNPAGMSFVYGNRFDNTFAFISPSVTWTNSFGSFEDRSAPYVPLPSYGFGVTLDPNKPIDLAPVFDFGTWGLDRELSQDELDRIESLSDEEFQYGSPLRVGFGVFPVTGGVIQIDDLLTSGFRNPDGSPRGVDWETDVIQLAITPSISYRINEWFSIGLTLQVHYSEFELDGGIAQPRGVLRDDIETFDLLLTNNRHVVTETDMDDARTWGFSWSIGCMFRPSDTFRIGLVYQDRTYSADYLGRVLVSSDDEIAALTGGVPGILGLFGIDPSLGFTSEYDLRIQDHEQPRRFGLGFAWDLHPRVSIGADYTYIGWREVGRQLKARLSNGDNPNQDILVSETIDVRVPLRLRDQHVLAIGGSVLVYRGDDITGDGIPEGYPSWSLVLRAGYNYARRATPRDTVLPQVPLISEHHVSGGFSLRIGPRLEITGAVEYALPTTVNTGTHQGDFTLSNSEQEVSILFGYFGLGVDF